MAWVTKSVIAGEIKSEAEARQNDIGNEWAFDTRAGLNSGHFTGNYGMYAIGPAGGLGTALDYPGIDSVRAGYWFKSLGWTGDSILHFFSGFNIDDCRASTRWYIYVDIETYTLKLREYDDVSAIYYTRAAVDNVTPILGMFNEWKHISMYSNFSSGEIKFWVNGVLLIDSTLSTLPAYQYIYAADSGFFGNIAGYILVDDLYFDYSTSSEVSDIPPARRYYPALPDGAGTHTDWTPDSGSNYDRVNESSDPDDDTSYVSAASIGDKDTYNFAALSNVNPEASPESAIVQAYVRTNPIDGGIGELRFLSILSATEVSTAEVQRIRPQQDHNFYCDGEDILDWIVLSGYFDTKPTTGEWTESDFNSSEFGIEARGLV